MIYLNEEDILKLITLDEIMDAIKKAYRIYGENKFNMP